MSLSRKLPRTVRFDFVFKLKGEVEIHFPDGDEKLAEVNWAGLTGLDKELFEGPMLHRRMSLTLSRKLIEQGIQERQTQAEQLAADKAIERL